MRQQLATNVNMDFIYISPGEFWMGSPEDESGRNSNEKRHRVRLTRGYYMQTTPVTQAQWEAVTGENPSRFKQAGPNAPVEQVSWDDVQEFIRKLNQRERTDRFRLPMEAEWEYACRAGTETAFCNGPITDLGGLDLNLDKVGWFDGNSGGTTQPVGKKEPNAWGLYDMHGNVWEWCQDWFGAYLDDPVTASRGPEKGSDRVLRGGSWSNGALFCRSTSRVNCTPSARFNGIGCRLVAESDEKRLEYCCGDCGERTFYTPEDLPDHCDNCGSWTELRGSETAYNSKSRYYDAGGIETIDIIRAKLTPEQFRGFLLGNALKYLSRLNHKNQAIRDAEKAFQYTKWLKEEMEE